MKAERKSVLLLFAISLAYVLCAGSILFAYVRTHPGEPIPRFVSVPLLCLLILTVTGGTFVTNHIARKQAKTETLEEGHLRRLRAIKGLKTGLVVWSLILLNDIRMLLQGTIRLGLAIPGFVVVLLITAVTWASLKRLQKAEAAYQSSGQKQSQ